MPQVLLFAATEAALSSGGRQGAGPVPPAGPERCCWPGSGSLARRQREPRDATKPLWTAMNSSISPRLSPGRRGGPGSSCTLGEVGLGPGRAWVLGPGTTWFVTSGLLFDASSP